MRAACVCVSVWTHSEQLSVHKLHRIKCIKQIEIRVKQSGYDKLTTCINSIELETNISIHRCRAVRSNIHAVLVIFALIGMFKMRSHIILILIVEMETGKTFAFSAYKNAFCLPTWKWNVFTKCFPTHITCSSMKNPTEKPIQTQANKNQREYVGRSSIDDFY